MSSGGTFCSRVASYNQHSYVITTQAPARLIMECTMRRKCTLLCLFSLLALALGACVTPAAPANSPAATPGEPGPTATAGGSPTPTEPPAPLATDTAPASTATPRQPASPTPGLTVAPLTGSGPGTGNATPEPAIEPGTQPVIAQAQADLARRLQVNADQITVLSAQSVTWPDGSLGCPRPGMSYTQVTVDGILIRLRAGNQVYEYHGGGGRPPFVCETGPGAKTAPQPPAPSQPIQ